MSEDQTIQLGAIYMIRNILETVAYVPFLWVLSICDTGAQNPSLVGFGFLILSYSTLHLLQNTFYRIKISCF